MFLKILLKKFFRKTKICINANKHSINNNNWTYINDKTPSSNWTNPCANSSPYWLWHHFHIERCLLQLLRWWIRRKNNEKRAICLYRNHHLQHQVNSGVVIPRTLHLIWHLLPFFPSFINTVLSLLSVTMIHWWKLCWWHPTLIWSVLYPCCYQKLAFLRLHINSFQWHSDYNRN